MPWASIWLQLPVGLSSARQTDQLTRGPGPWSPLGPDLRGGCTLALESAAAIGRARSSAAPGAWENVRSWARPRGAGGRVWGALLVFFCFSVNVNTNHTLICAGREVAGFETPLLGNLK